MAPPGRAPAAVDWAAVGSRLGRPLPADYKWLVETDGPGKFGGFFRVFCPGSPHQSLDLEHQYERTTWALRYLAERGHSLPRDPTELLSFGRSDNGDVAYWIIGEHDDPDQWTVAVGEARGPLWEEYEGGVVEWLEAVFSRRIRVKLFPKDFPRHTVRFDRLSPRDGSAGDGRR